MKVKWFTSIILCLLLTFLLCMPASAEKNTSGAFTFDAKDVPSNHWAKEAIQMLNEHKIILGYQGFFRPDDPITRVEYCALINRAFGYFKKGETSIFKDSGNDPNNWKDEEIMKASYQGYLKGSGGYAFPDRNITREEAMVILARVLRKEPMIGNTTFIDDNEVSDWAKPLVTALWKESYVRGYAGKLSPKANITRAEAAQLIYNSIGQLLDKGGIYDMGNKILGHVTISTPGVVLKNAIIKGNLYITEGVGDGTVTLEDVKVEGQTVIAGGGVNSIIIINTSLGRAVIDVPDGASVRFAAQGNSTVDTVMIFSDSIIDNTGSQNSIESVVIALPEDASVELSGNFGIVEVETSSIAVNVEDSSINQLIVASTAIDAEINLNHTTTVGSLVCDAQCQILGEGQIASAFINVNGVTLEQRPRNLTLPKGIKVHIAGIELSSGYSDTTGSMTDPIEGSGSDTGGSSGHGGDSSGSGSGSTGSGDGGGSSGSGNSGGNNGGSGSGGSGSSGGSGGDSGSGDNEEEKTYTLRVVSNPQGAATITGAGVYKPGDSATLVANPISGWKFRNWTVDGIIISTNQSLSMSCLRRT